MSKNMHDVRKVIDIDILRKHIHLLAILLDLVGELLSKLSPTKKEEIENPTIFLTSTVEYE